MCRSVIRIEIAVLLLTILYLGNLCHCLKLIDTNPDIFRNSTELIRSRGFDYELHNVTTRDGYILSVFRVVNPYRRPTTNSTNSGPYGRPVILWHGVAVTSDSWLFSTSGQLDPTGTYTENNKLVNNCDDEVTDTLGYTLAACGYDVWLPNSRGNVYASQHTRYNANVDSRYWQFTLTEMAIYDVPAVISYILRQTNQTSLAYVGHSLGTDIMFCSQSLMPEIGTLVRPFVALAPVAYIGEIWSSARLGVPLEPLLRLFPGPLGVAPPLMQFLGSFVCGNEFLVQICADVLYTINGFDQSNFNKSVVPVNVAHSAAKTSTWVYAHLAQLVVNRQYQMFDFGSSSENLARYGSTRPPEYPLQNITSPDIALFRGLSDPLADSKDINRLTDNLKVPLLDNYIVPYSKWNHQDFQLGISQGFYVNGRLLRILKRYD